MATGLVVSRSMFSDHVPDVALKGLQMVGEEPAGTATRARVCGGVCVGCGWRNAAATTYHRSTFFLVR